MDFFTTFAIEEACERHLLEMRWPDGVPGERGDTLEFTPTELTHFNILIH